MPFHERNAKNRCADRGVLRIPTVRFGSIPLKNSVLALSAAWPGSRNTDCLANGEANEGAKAPLQLRWASQFPLPGLSASTTLPFFADSARWPPIGTHRGHLSGREVASDPVAGCV